MRAGLKFVFFASYAKIITNLLSFSEVAPTGSFAVLQLIRWFLGFDQGRSTIDDTNQMKTGPPRGCPQRSATSRGHGWVVAGPVVHHGLRGVSLSLSHLVCQSITTSESVSQPNPCEPSAVPSCEEKGSSEASSR